jgi:hypothetical protein
VPREVAYPLRRSKKAGKKGGGGGAKAVKASRNPFELLGDM